MTVRELLTRMDSRELAEWGAYYRLRGWEAEHGRQARMERGDRSAGVTLGGAGEQTWEE